MCGNARVPTPMYRFLQLVSDDVTVLQDIPQQMNGSDCGMFACTFAEFSSRGARYTFSQAHMPYLRRKAALEILQARLLL